jgi:hypothetical protein
MKLRIEIREGPPSMFNPEANLYVVALHPEIGLKHVETGEPLGEKNLGGPMTERNAIAMVETIRAKGLPKKALQEPAAVLKDGEEPPEPEPEPNIDGMELPKPLPEPEEPKQPSDLWIPAGYFVGLCLFAIVVVYFLGLR